MLDSSIRFFIQNKLLAFFLMVVFLFWGLVNSPFDLDMGIFPKNPVAVDAIPDIGENQQIVFTKWEGQSPRDIEDQVTYPLTSNLTGLPKVKAIRGSSMFGFSTIYIIFEDDVDFYWARSRILEKLNSLPNNLLPSDTKPVLGPDATALSQLFWYTLEGRDDEGNITGGWDLHEIRSIQDFYVKNALVSTSGVTEVSSIGGYVQEYQVDVNPELMRQYGVTLSEVVKAVKNSNKDIGAKTLEINKAEYFVRGLGYVKSVEDLGNSEVKSADFTPIRIKDVANVTLGPAERRGILDKEGAEVVGGVVVARNGANPMQTIRNIKKKLKEIAPGMPTKILKDGRVSRLTVVPFYDRSQLIEETLETLGNALTYEILITILVVMILLFNLRISILISGLMPFTVLIVFITMKWFDVEANIVALSGIAIAIGTVVDMGIILSENIVRHIDLKPADENFDEVVYQATTEVSGAILTAGLTTIVSFIPVFVLTGAEGKLFSPLAFTKTIALFASMIIALFLIPPLAALLLRRQSIKPVLKWVYLVLLLILGVLLLFFGNMIGIVALGFCAISILNLMNRLTKTQSERWQMIFGVISVIGILGYYWRPLGYQNHFSVSLLFVVFICFFVLGLIYVFHRFYEHILNWALDKKHTFLVIPTTLLVLGFLIMITSGREFMPPLDEGSYLLMPTAMPHSGTSENKKLLAQLDMAVANIPEVETVVGKAGRVESALDPAPLSMFENIILYKPEYIMGDNGRPEKFRINEDGLFKTISGDFVSSGNGVEKSELIPDSGGDFYRNWRPEIKNRQDIWEAIVEVTQLPGVTSAPQLQPIETRLVMLQSGMRSPMGIKIKGDDLREIEAFGLQLETILKEVDGIASQTVYADRIVGKPYLLVDIDRDRATRYGLSIAEVLEVVEVAVGGKVLTYSFEGRERYSIRVRYPRELRATPNDLNQIHISLENEGTVPLSELVVIRYEEGPRHIKSEDGFLIGHVLFDKSSDSPEADVIANAQKAIEHKIDSGLLTVPQGVSYAFAGTYENQLHAERTLAFVLPMVLLTIFLILYLQFRSVSVSLMVFSGVAVAFAGGFVLIWLYGETWFMNFGLGGVNFRNLFNMQTINLSVAVWVGFIALFGIATDDGVVMATYLKQTFEKNSPTNIISIRASVIEAGKRESGPA